MVRGRVLWQEAGALSPWGLAARDSFVEALRLDPAHVEALYLLACHDMASERWESAEQRVRRAAELQPALGPVARDLLGRIPPPEQRRGYRDEDDEPFGSGLVADLIRPVDSPPRERPAWRAEYLDPPRSGSRAWSLVGVVVVLILRRPPPTTR